MFGATERGPLLLPPVLKSAREGEACPAPAIMNTSSLHLLSIYSRSGVVMGALRC